MKPKSANNQMKALDEHFVMVVFTLLLNGVNDFANFLFNFDRETWQCKGPFTLSMFAAILAAIFAAISSAISL